jgi:hypothetical protein
MDKPPFSLAFVMVKESFAVPAILFYLAAMLIKTSVRTTLRSQFVRTPVVHKSNLNMPVT